VYIILHCVPAGGIDKPVLHDVTGDTSKEKFHKPMVWHKTLTEMKCFSTFHWVAAFTGFCL